MSESNLEVGSGAGKVRAVFDAGLFPSWRRRWWEWLGDHNPCLLLSTVCMLLGCYLVSSALRAESDSLKVLGLLGVMNVYELCIIPLGLVLIRRTRGTARDGWWLILFELLFLVNATFVNPDFGPKWAVPLNAGLWVLACVKGAIVLKGLRIGLGVRTWVFLAAQLGIIYALPVVFALTQVGGDVPPRVMYGLWWVVGLLPVAYDVAARVWWRHEPWDLVQNVVRRVYVIAPWVMLVVHMGFSHWAHHCDFAGADVGPVVLGLAAASRRVNLGAGWQRAAWYVPAMALVLTVMWPAEGVRWAVGLGDGVREVAAGHVMLAGTILTYGYMGTIAHLLWAAGAVMAAGAGYVFMGWIVAGMRWVLEVAGAVVGAVVRFVAGQMPATAMGWGVAAIGAAFVLLGIGGYLSLRRMKAAGHGQA